MADESPKAQILGGQAACGTTALRSRRGDRSTHRSAWALWERTPLLMDFARSAGAMRPPRLRRVFGFWMRTSAFRRILCEIVTVSLLRGDGALIRHIRDNSLPGSPPRRPAEPRPVNLGGGADAFRVGRCPAKTRSGDKISGKL
jgi:hypothetical protein